VAEITVEKGVCLNVTGNTATCCCSAGSWSQTAGKRSFRHRVLPQSDRAGRWSADSGYPGHDSSCTVSKISRLFDYITQTRNSHYYWTSA